MEPPLPPPSSSSTKLRLMCSYGGHIVPRPHDKSLFYAGGETRIVAFDRRTTATSLSSLISHLSRKLFQNRPFHLKYQIPDEDLDSLISVVTDEDLFNMLEEHDRITAPSRIRLFLFPVRPESLGSSLLDPKSDSWFSDALKSTRIMQSASADSGLLVAYDSVIEPGSKKLVAESVVLETSSSFGSTSSSFSMSNSPPVTESEKSITRASSLPKSGISEEPLIQIAPEVTESIVSNPSISNMPTQKVSQYETQLLEGGLQYAPQYPANPMPYSPYYHPVYQMPMHQQHLPCPPNQPYPIYLVPVRPPQYHNMSMQCNFMDANTTTVVNRPPLYPQTAVITAPIAHKEVYRAQPVAESATKDYQNSNVSTPLIDLPSNEVKIGTFESENASDQVKDVFGNSDVQSSDFDEDIAYNQIYKTQPLPPILPSQYQTMTKGTAIV